MRWPVLLMARELDLGGSERQLTVIAKALDRSQFEPYVGCFRPRGVRGKELEAAGVPIAHFPVYSFASPGALAGAWKLARFVRERKIRLVHTFDYPMTVFGIPAGRMLTRSIVVSSQRSHRELIPPNYRRLVRMTDRMADAIVVNCEFVKRHLQKDEGVPAGRIELCYNGVDLGEFRPGESERPRELPAGALVIGVLCTLRPEKGLLTLLDAFAKVRGARAEMKLVLVGSGSMLETLQSRAGKLRISGDCIFAGAAENVADWLRAIDIFVLPSKSEALSNSLMEAMACGCCAVASDIGGNPELIRSGETGLLFESGDVAGLAAALELLIANDALRGRLARAGTAVMQRRFSDQASAERMGQIYADLIERRERGRGAG